MALSFNELFVSDCTEEIGLHLKKPTAKEKLLTKYSKRTINDYKILTKEIREDYEWALNTHLDRYESNKDMFNQTESPNGYFVINGAYVEAILLRDYPR